MPSLSSAQDAQPSDYRSVVRAAVRESAARNYEEARSLFMRAHQIYPNARTHRGLGMVEFELRHYPACIAQLEAALRSDVHPLDPELRASTGQLLARARDFVGSLTVVSKPPASELRIDGAPVTSAPGEPMLLNVGEHLVELYAPQYLPERRKVDLAGREQKTLSIQFAQLLHPNDGALSSHKRWYKSPWLWSAVGAVAIGAVVTTVILAGDRSRTVMGEINRGNTGVELSAPSE
jgi:tetratricopeptide (TPR) repeat protein